MMMMVVVITERTMNLVACLPKILKECMNMILILCYLAAKRGYPYIEILLRERQAIKISFQKKNIDVERYST